MTTETTEQAPTRCIECKVPVKRIEGTTLTRGRVPNWMHDWSGYATLADRPKCKLNNGPLWDDQVEGIPEGEETGTDYPGEDDADD